MLQQLGIARRPHRIVLKSISEMHNVIKKRQYRNVDDVNIYIWIEINIVIAVENFFVLVY